MSPQRNRQERAMLLLERIGTRDYSVAEARAQFTLEEVREAKVIAHGGEYHLAELALDALIEGWPLAGVSTAGEREFFPTSSSRPAAQEVVEITYLCDEDGAKRRGPGFWNGHVVNGSQWYLLRPFGHQPVHVLSWRPFNAPVQS